ncbi:hypothetical protein CERSUDRAFT_118538 [Gelatoporia subvermispora B]|uniref:DUF6534 domain-containing protein n=1 Tax=Ceriporiopsis subvermispora (strain B) TaxID=914234 RepID=M2Q6Q8_CERS8|nr:hypothetical protein CERSUDRAFT_118538 [Gelatoporia subvermispora B]
MFSSSPRPTVGSILVGGLLSSFLSGTVFMQFILYFRIYPNDAFRIKSMVAAIWALDMFHTIMIYLACWDYLIRNWTNDAIFDYIPWMIGVTVALTALITFIVQCFFAYRVYTVSNRNIYVTAPIAFLALLRVVFALVSMGEMIRLSSYSAFSSRYGWVFTTGLSLSSALDVLVTVSLCYFLRRSRSGFKGMNHIIDLLTLYTVQNGLLTGVTTIAALILWLALSNSLLFLTLHFCIAKLYANSLLATLNARKSLRRAQTTVESHSMPVILSSDLGRLGRFSSARDASDQSGDVPMSRKPVQINVEKTVNSVCDYDVEAASPTDTE